ncbi:CpsD/CapB family tyrosine-protein kinase [bacterium]|nr:CpsD/CapB family tyrosine-protein kinase [Akkermansiaceae bacterium]MDA7911592.1 CpsD/CapB family tyrosine-protein kinase [Akkermansiaceae bacterium]MDB4358576.1 CpsD/CapB family tyrosine-protein kinase [bacterium]
MEIDSGHINSTYLVEFGSEDGLKDHNVLQRINEAEKLLDQKENALANYQIILLTLADLEKRETTFNELDLRYFSKNPTLIAAKNALEDYRFRFLLVRLDNRFHTVRQVELMSGLPILATIQSIDLKVLGQLKAEKEKQLKVSDPSGMKMWDSRLISRSALLQTLYTEAYPILRASVTLLGKEDQRKVSLFTSSIPGEEKTTTSSNFAIAAAQQGKKTVQVDFDLRKPAVHKAFGLKRRDLPSGLTEVLTGKATLAEAMNEQARQENFSIIFAGQKAPNPGELLTTEGAVALLKELDVIVVDSAPLLAVPDTRLIVPEVDNFCLVVRAEYTPKGAVAKCLDMQRDDDNEPAGIVVNDYQERGGFARKYLYKCGSYGHMAVAMDRALMGPMEATALMRRKI